MLSPKKDFQIWPNISYSKETCHALEESERQITSELQESQALKSSTDLNKFKNLMSALNVDFSMLEKSEMTISHTSLSAKTPLHAQSF